MQVRLAGSLALAVALLGCGGQRAPVDRHLPAAIATPPNDAALLRMPHSGGKAELLRANTLIGHQTAAEGLPAIAHILGASRDDETVYATDNAGRPVAIDLKSQRSRVLPTSARTFVTTSDGTILGVDSAHHPVRLVNRGFTTYKALVDKGTALYRAPSDQILAVGNKAGTVQVLGPSVEVRHVAIPSGQVVPTWVGDLVAVVTDSGIAFADVSGRTLPKKGPPKFVKLKGNPTIAAFSPSGHRLYIARKTGGLVMLDRFTRTPLKVPVIDAAPSALRADRSGRWLMAHSSTGDSLWVIDVTRWAVTWSGVAPWSEDLPQVIDGRELLLRRKNDVLAIDLSSADHSDPKVLSGGASDLYIMLPWVPRASGQTDVAAAPPPPAATTTRDSAATVAPPVAQAPPPSTTEPPPVVATAPPISQTVPTVNPEGKIYVQVSSSQSADWAQALARQLKDGGFPAKVLEPKTSDESYRVVVGPYGSRDEADTVGKRLGRPYFIIHPE